MGRRLVYHEIQKCRKLLYTKHARTRMKERFDFTEIRDNLQMCRYGFEANNKMWHLYLDSGKELVGHWDGYEFMVVTVYPKTFSEFKRKMYQAIHYG